MDRPAYLDQAGVSDADWEQTPVSVKRLVEVLIERLVYQEQQNQKIQADIEWLKEKLTRDSGNSSLPPSSDKKKQTYPKRERSGKKRGGQPGHELHCRQLFAVEDCETVKDYYPEQCWQCGSSLHQEAGEPQRHQIVELPVIVPLVYEYRLHQCLCERCNQEAGEPQSDPCPIAKRSQRKRLWDASRGNGWGPQRHVSPIPTDGSRRDVEPIWGQAFLGQY